MEKEPHFRDRQRSSNLERRICSWHTFSSKDNTWSAGCQTLPPTDHALFFKTLNAKQKDFNYVLVDI